LLKKSYKACTKVSFRNQGKQSIDQDHPKKLERLVLFYLGIATYIIFNFFAVFKVP